MSKATGVRVAFRCHSFIFPGGHEPRRGVREVSLSERGSVGRVWDAVEMWITSRWMDGREGGAPTHTHAYTTKGGGGGQHRVERAHVTAEKVTREF